MLVIVLAMLDILVGAVEFVLGGVGILFSVCRLASCAPD